MADCCQHVDGIPRNDILVESKPPIKVGHPPTCDADTNRDTRTLTEYLNDSMNFTGYSQVLRETHIDADTDEIQKVVEYTIGHDQISQTTIPYSGGTAGSPSSVYFAADGHGSTSQVGQAPPDDAERTW